jgi:FixJ family two-component response regulator
MGKWHPPRTRTLQKPSISTPAETDPCFIGVDDALLNAIRQAIERSRVALHRAAELQQLRDCYASLSLREREVMALVVSGLLNKQVGGELGISEITVKAHRGQVMRKMKADSLPNLVTMAARLGLPAPKH